MMISKGETMNQVQKSYITAKEAFRAVELTLNKKEREFLKGKGRNEDHVWMIDNETIFNLLNEEFSALTIDLNNEYNTAKGALKDAENALVEYGLSIAPTEIRETLRRESKRLLSVREQLIDMVIRLDTKTVKA
jgi:hypothetical protein